MLGLPTWAARIMPRRAGPRALRMLLQAPLEEAVPLIHEEIVGLVDSIRRRPDSSGGGSYDEEGRFHARGGYARAIERGDANAVERQAYGYTKVEVEALQALLARRDGWAGHLLHPSRLGPADKKRKRKFRPCYCRRCVGLRRSKRHYCTFEQAEAALLEALFTGQAEHLHRAATGADRGRAHRERRREEGRCYRCDNRAAPGKTICEPCNELAKIRVKLSRTRRRQSLKQPSQPAEQNRQRGKALHVDGTRQFSHPRGV